MRLALVILVLSALFPLGACDDPTFSIDPIIVEDTVLLAAPTPDNTALPTALDVTSDGQSIGGGRFPERAAEAGLFDFVVRERGDDLLLVPAGALGLQSGAGITRPVSESFDELIEAPGRGSFLTDTAVVLRTGEVYVARSREGASGFSACEQYAKLQPLEVDAAADRVRIRVVTNARGCDPRLALEG